MFAIGPAFFASAAPAAAPPPPPPFGAYAIWNAADKGAACVLSAASLRATGPQADGSVRSTVSVDSGKWYWEVTSSGNRFPITGIGRASATLATYPGGDADGYAYYGAFTLKVNALAFEAYGVDWTGPDVIGVALDMDAGTLEFYRNGASMGIAYSGLVGSFFAMTGGDSGAPSDTTANFGQFAFAHEPPAGFNAGLYGPP
ncbi:MAG: SPRY domain-containing protein [Burkholderiaceae bacterium]